MHRRAFLQRTGLAGLSLLATRWGVNRAVADPDLPPENAPGAISVSEPEVHSFKIGNAAAFVIHDGVLAFPGIQPTLLPEAKPAELQELFVRSYLPLDRFAMSLNVLVIQGADGVMLFDAGAGRSLGPTVGKLLRGLAKIGIAPAEVKSIFVTHAHTDHIGGLVDDANKPVFSSARIIAPSPEVGFWTSENPDLAGMRTTPEMKIRAVADAKKTFKAVGSQLVTVEAGNVAPGVDLISAPGHTPGHSMFQVAPGGGKLLVIGDIAHVFAAQFAHPEWNVAFDVNPPLAAKTRRRVFQQLADDRTLVLGYHMPFPGLGHVRADGRAFEWVPKPWAT